MDLPMIRRALLVKTRTHRPIKRSEPKLLPSGSLAVAHPPEQEQGCTESDSSLAISIWLSRQQTRRQVTARNGKNNGMVVDGRVGGGTVLCSVLTPSAGQEEQRHTSLPVPGSCLPGKPSWPQAVEIGRLVAAAWQATFAWLHNQTASECTR